MRRGNTGVEFNPYSPYNNRSQKGGSQIMQDYSPPTGAINIADFGSNKGALAPFSLPDGQSTGPNLSFGLDNGGGNDFANILSEFQTEPSQNNGFLSNFKNDDGSLNFDNIGGALGIGKDIIGSLMAIKQFGLAEKGLEHGIGLDKANLANSAKLAQSRLDLQSQRRAQEGTGITNNDPQLQQTIGG